MNKASALALMVSLLLAFLLPPPPLSAEPILKPKKYHGPIPKRYFTFNVGFLAGPDNEAMWSYLDGLIDEPLQKETSTSDFGASLALDAVYSVKLHPQFAVRSKIGVAFLGSQSTGLLTGAEPDTSGLLPLFNFERTFDVTLFSLEVSALFFFQDASVNDFQTYMGGGFGAYFPWERYKRTLVDVDTGSSPPVFEEEDFSVEPGIHGILGFIYHIQTALAVHAEGRVRLVQGKFLLTVPTDDAGLQPINFDVDYSGFVLVAGISKFF